MAKHDEGKPKPSLLYREFLYEVARSRQFGTEKYGDPENWRTVEPERYIDAALRHIIEYYSGEKYAPDSGIHHLAHACCSLMFIMQLDMEEASMKTQHIKLTDVTMEIGPSPD